MAGRQSAAPPLILTLAHRGKSRRQFTEAMRLAPAAHQTRHTTRLGCHQLGDVAIPDTFANALE